MDRLWRLIENKAQAIAVYSEYLDGFVACDSTGKPEEDPVAATIQHIIGDERDHLKALLNLHDSMTKNKAATGTTEFVRQALADFRERSKLIK